MFIAYYELENSEPYFNIYFKNDMDTYFRDIFNTYNLEVLDLKITGDTYAEKKEHLKNLAIKFQNGFSYLSWSYSEIAIIQNWFFKNAKRFGLLKEFKENGIC